MVFWYIYQTYEIGVFYTRVAIEKKEKEIATRYFFRFAFATAVAIPATNTATPAATPKVGRNELTRGRRGALSGAKRGTCTSVSMAGAMPTMTVATCLGGEQRTK